jgi:glycosyltransferase involved in cell wall biosynthesis
MNQLKIFYGIQRYQSHYRVGQAYRQLLSSSYPIVNTIADSDIAILHVEPHDYHGLYSKYPSLRDKYVISYCVWEASELPEVYKRSLSLVQEVWTCSTFCKDIIQKHHSRVTLIPHVVSRDLTVESQDREFIKNIISHKDGCYYFLSIGRTKGFRKNINGMVRAFESTATQMPNARLVIKGIPKDPILTSPDPRIVYISQYFTDSQMNALYLGTNAYVSAHHSEGWGLTLSDAMLLGRPLIATGYSGNLDFMTDDNSFLINAKEKFIDPNEIFGLFNTSMKWGEPDYDQLRDTMRSLCDGSSQEKAQRQIDSAKAQCLNFSPGEIQKIMLRRLESIRTEMALP